LLCLFVRKCLICQHPTKLRSSSTHYRAINYCRTVLSPSQIASFIDMWKIYFGFKKKREERNTISRVFSIHVIYFLHFFSMWLMDVCFFLFACTYVFDPLKRILSFSTLNIRFWFVSVSLLTWFGNHYSLCLHKIIRFPLDSGWWIVFIRKSIIAFTSDHLKV
jgi:hypothetical protein